VSKVENDLKKKWRTRTAQQWKWTTS